MTPQQFLDAVRSRLRRVRGLHRLLRWGWIPILGALTLVLVARLIDSVLLEPVAIAVVVVGLAACVIVGWWGRPSDLEVAILADRQLGSRDALSAFVEFSSDPPAQFAGHIETRAENIVASTNPKHSVEFPTVGRGRIAAVVLGPLLVLALAVAPNPQDKIREQNRAVEAAKTEVIKDLREAATRLDPESSAAKELEKLAENLLTANPEEALKLMRESEAELAELAGPSLESARAATEGLDSSLASRPLPGATGNNAADQLDLAAKKLPSMSPQERGELAERLRSLAATQAAGSPDVAAALSEAADAVESGAPDAGEKLSEAATQQRAASSSVAARTAAADAAAAAGQSRAKLGEAMAGGKPSEQAQGAKQPGQGQGTGAGQGQGQGSGKGQGSGQGSGKGQGTGQGSGKGQGQGSGQGGQGGQGQGSGGATGQVSGGNRTGSGSGQGGVGSVGAGGNGADPGVEGGKESSANSPVFAPDPRSRLSPDGPGSTSGGDLGQSAGQGDTSTQTGSARTSLQEAVRRYSDDAARVARQPGLPASQRQLINDYFARLSGAS